MKRKRMACNCGGTLAQCVKHPERCPHFYCRGCRIWQPWCCGAADKRPELCDECVARLPRAEWAAWAA